MSNSLRILIIIGACLLVGIVIAIVLVKISNKKKAKKLQETLEQYKTSNQVEQNSDLSLSNDVKSENVTEEEIFGTPQEPPPQPSEISRPSSFFTTSDGRPVNPLIDEPSYDPMPQEPPSTHEEKNYPRMPSQKTREVEDAERASRDEDFEQFLDEHAFSRKVFDKTLLEDLQNMSPEMKSIILGSIFDKFDGDDK